jgi:hypothetical protein
MPVVAAPMAFTVARPRQPGGRSLRQRKTMPVCDSVKLVKTPTT